MVKEILWIRNLSCGHERATNIAFMSKNYEKPKIGNECYCRECWNLVKIIEVYDAISKQSEVEK